MNKLKYIFLLGAIVFLNLSFLGYYYIGVTTSDCGTCPYSGSWIRDVIIQKDTSTITCPALCPVDIAPSVIPNPLFTSLGSIGFMLLGIGVIFFAIDALGKNNS